jgi:hypothetical protein
MSILPETCSEAIRQYLCTYLSRSPVTSPGWWACLSSSAGLVAVLVSFRDGRASQIEVRVHGLCRENVV